MSTHRIDFISESGRRLSCRPHPACLGCRHYLRRLSRPHCEILRLYEDPCQVLERERREARLLAIGAGFTSRRER